MVPSHYVWQWKQGTVHFEMIRINPSHTEISSHAVVSVFEL
jgi:hypothetical protein